MLQEKEFLKQKAKQLLLSILSIYTPSGNEKNAESFFINVSKEFNLPLKITKSNSYFLSPGGKILLAPHVDTVPGFIEPHIENDIVFGRGAVDDKGPLIAMLLATWIALENGKKVSFIALSDEENKSAGARELLNEGINFEHIIVGEPTNTKNVVTEYRGLMHLDIICKAKSEHSSSATQNIIIDMSRKINEISLLPSTYDKPSIVPTIIRSGEYMNVTPSDAYLHLDVRYPYNTDKSNILSPIYEQFKDCEIKIIESVDPVKVSVNSPAVKAVMKGLIKQGIKPSIVRKAGTSDMNILKNITQSIVTYGPGDSKLEHTELEKITLDEIYIGIQTYLNAIEELC
ncbi:N-acetyl-lysine deacetylase [Acidianus brierleyi]|uniref:[LysW]-lysine/[LysW]-ornithine hydrolase n=1 Tax=Acidianus brierleyi TaxID=41673 RepID=A0A2U9IE69_9CREN|nr:N-acetyl-lysine deacetylase [Acidianus brierleyi]AWR94305.1 N-acetyl-lysine deacetylase [Acidianus brierleyi]